MKKMKMAICSSIGTSVSIFNNTVIFKINE